MLPRINFLLVVGALLLSTGCLGVKTERIRIRRSPTLLQEKVSLKRKDYNQIIQERADAKRALEIPHSLEVANVRYEVADHKVRVLIDGIPPDPWEAEERDRRRVLVKFWADASKPPPEPEPLPGDEEPEAAEEDGEEDMEGEEDEEDMEGEEGEEDEEDW